MQRLMQQPPVEKPSSPDSARSAGLRYTTDERPGISRVRRGKGFAYIAPAGEPVRDDETLARIRSLAIPPAWTAVWISPWPRGHLQATGRDARGRKQYRYHPLWRQIRDEAKYHRMIAFGEALPRIRARVEDDLSLPALPRAKVLATVIRLLETTLIRVGNEEYAQENGSYGLTTLRNRHVKVDGSHVYFAFKGKSGVKHRIDVNDRRLSRIVRRCQDLPGEELFQYIDEAGETRGVDSADVNTYLHMAGGEEFTAKDFRTWAATVLAAEALGELGPCEAEAEARRKVATAVESVAKRLGNTVAVCRKSYVHPAVIEAYLDGSLGPLAEQQKPTLTAGVRDLAPTEAAVLDFLKQVEEPHVRH